MLPNHRQALGLRRKFLLRTDKVERRRESASLNTIWHVVLSERGHIMKRLSTFALAIVVVFVMAVGTNAQIKNVLLEQHTGAWCGWCPDGTVVMDEILDLYGDQVIGVKIHCGDAMEIFEHFIIADALGLRGFPTGSIDRKDFGGAVFLSRNKWRSSCESQIQQTAEDAICGVRTTKNESRTVLLGITPHIISAERTHRFMRNGQLCWRAYQLLLQGFVRILLGPPEILH